MAMKRKNLPEVVPEFFEHEQFGQFRYIKRDEELWFVANDVCRVLGYANPRDALAKHVDDDEKGVAKCDTLGGVQTLAIINESGLYSLIFGSTLPAAKKFKRWVTHEVLPSIRKYGFYGLLNGEQVRQLPIREYVHYLGQLTPEQYKNYLRQLTTEQGREHYKRLRENLSNMTQEEIKNLANDPDIIVSRIGHGSWKAKFFC